MQQIPDDLAWEFPRHQLKFVSMIGEGCFGQVWKYETESIAEMEGRCLHLGEATKVHWRSYFVVSLGPSTVAVKTLRSSATEKEKKDLLHELSVMKMLDPHPNVVRLLGCCTEKGQNLKEMYCVTFNSKTFFRSNLYYPGVRERRHPPGLPAQEQVTAQLPEPPRGEPNTHSQRLDVLCVSGKKSLRVTI